MEYKRHHSLFGKAYHSVNIDFIPGVYEPLHLVILNL
jgi:hypothetical protein